MHCSCKSFRFAQTENCWKQQHIQLNEQERTELVAFLANGNLGAKGFKRATALLELDRGKTLSSVAQPLGVSYPTV